jgi:HD-GYP domain-containing protein (c-di-GMP phosphodiesterase class II)
MTEEGVRLAELVAALSLGIDLGFGQPMEHVLRQCLIALRIGERLDLDDGERAALYYAALLVNVGCHSDAHEQARWFGDDIELKKSKYEYEPMSMREALGMVSQIGAGSAPLHRLRVGLEFMVSGRKDVDDMIASHARLARALGAELQLSPTTLDNLVHSYERWDGKGYPGDLAGDDIPVGARVVQLAEYVEVSHRVGGVEDAKAMARRRSGSQFDPSHVDLLCLDAEKILHDLDEVGSWQEVIDSEPALTIYLSPDECDAALTAIATFIDLKSPYTLGHSRAVGELSAAAGRQLNLGEDDIRLLQRGGLVANFGRLGVSNTIWDKAGPLRAGEWERVRMHPYFAERMLQQSEPLAPLARVAVQHRERLDGSGYPRGLAGNSITQTARIVGAADAYQAMREPRPYRPARSAEEAAAELRADVRAGRMDADAVEAVLAAAGHRVIRRREGPAGLTAREVEVLRLLARGLSNKAIAAELHISPKTAGNHVEHIYTKTGATNRAAASLFAMQNGLLPEEGFAPAG